MEAAGFTPDPRVLPDSRELSAGPSQFLARRPMAVYPVYWMFRGRKSSANDTVGPNFFSLTKVSGVSKTHNFTLISKPLRRGCKKFTQQKLQL
jgi:hypothetical protein